jgi:hypothetical protein
MRWNRILSSIATVGLLAASCGSEGEPDADTTDTATATTVAEVTVDSTIDDSVTDSTPPPTTAPPSVPDSVVDTAVTTTTNVAVDDQPGGADLFGLVDAGILDLTIDVPEGGVSGELLHLSFVNTSVDDIETRLPCGLVFAPDGELQRMMNLTPFDLELGAGGSTEVTPYVMCIDSSAPAPEQGASYEIAELASGDLLAFARCICEGGLLDEVDSMMGDMSLQIAVWAIADGELPDIDAAIAEADGALSDLLGQEGIDFDEIAEIIDAQGIDTGLPDGVDLEAMLGQAMGFFDEYLADAGVWLDRCNIELNE